MNDLHTQWRKLDALAYGDPVLRVQSSELEMRVLGMAVGTEHPALVLEALRVLRRQLGQKASNICLNDIGELQEQRQESTVAYV